MQIATWNVNSIRARLPRVLEWLERRKPDVVCLQEIKCVQAQFPREAIEELGYSVEIHGQKTYNGVAVLSRSPMCDVLRGFPGEAEGSEARVIGVSVGSVMVLNLYVVNGQEVGSPKYEFKLDWLARLKEFIDESYPSQAGRLAQKLVITGDFNITFDDRDIHDPEAWRGKVLCSEPERDALAEIMGLGLSDAFRKFDSEAGKYTWWDFRSRGFARGAGLRIDHFLMSDEALAACSSVVVDIEARGGEKPSDHAPVIATIAE